MSVPDAAAERLHNPYVDELLQSLRPPVHPLVNARQTQALIRRARDGGSRPVRRAGRNDLDLVGPAPGRQSVDNGLRPAVPDAARDGPSDEGRLVRPGRHRRHDHLPRRRQRRRQRAGDQPGMVARRRLEPARDRQPRPRSRGAARGGLTTQYTLRCGQPTDPPLALSHVPLRQMPPGATNLHGHLHEGTEPTARHINLALDQLGYSPAGLTWVLAEARRREWLAGASGSPVRAGSMKWRSAGTRCRPEWESGRHTSTVRTGPRSRRRRATAIDFRGY